jgi:hypothetical protein
MRKRRSYFGNDCAYVPLPNGKGAATLMLTICRGQGGRHD